MVDSSGDHGEGQNVRWCWQDLVDDVRNAGSAFIALVIG